MKNPENYPTLDVLLQDLLEIVLCWLLGLSVLNCGYEQRRVEEGYDQAFALVCEVFERPCRAGR